MCQGYPVWRFAILTEKFNGFTQPLQMLGQYIKYASTSPYEIFRQLIFHNSDHFGGQGYGDNI
jgi:hypothetical protein